MPTFIYALKDPETRKIRYIGATSHPERRLLEHLKDPRRNHRTNWIKSLKSRGLVPEMELLVEVPKSEAHAWEIKFIVTARRMGIDIVNSTDGGGGFLNLSPAAIAARGAARLGKPRSLETRAKIGAANAGKIRSPETLAALSAAHRGVPLSPAHCAGLSAAHKGKPWSVARRAAYEAKR